MPPVTLALLGTNIFVYFVVQQMGPNIIGLFALWPWASEWFRPWQVVTYAFLHGGLTHLAFNMFGLWMFGAELERVWGPRRMLLFYFASVLMAAVAQLLVTGLLGSQAPTIGASGGLFGLLIGFAMVFPRRMITPLIPPIPMRAPVFLPAVGLMTRPMRWCWELVTMPRPRRRRPPASRGGPSPGVGQEVARRHRPRSTGPRGGSSAGASCRDPASAWRWPRTPQ